MFINILKLAEKHKANIEGMLTWAFVFENQPYFDGFRTLATNGIDKPILNLFRMDGLMRGDRIAVESSAGVNVDAMIKNGVREAPDIDAIATKSANAVSVLMWNYHDDDVTAVDAPTHVTITGLPASVHRVVLKHYRIDRDHSNAYTAWKGMGSPQNPPPEQYAGLESAGQLQLLESPRWLWSESGKVETSFALPRQAVSLVQVSW
jgi:xylan 1,4-beta-xylosidase